MMGDTAATRAESRIRSSSENLTAHLAPHALILLQRKGFCCL
jgi:hypothetical protein